MKNQITPAEIGALARAAADDYLRTALAARSNFITRWHTRRNADELERGYKWAMEAIVCGASTSSIGASVFVYSALAGGKTMFDRGAERAARDWKVRTA